MSKIKILNDETWQDAIVNDNACFKFVKCGAEWCAPCKIMASMLDKVAEELTSENLRFYEVNVDDSYDIVEKYIVQQVPTMILFNKNGDEVSRIVSLVEEDTLKTMLKNYV